MGSPPSASETALKAVADEAEIIAGWEREQKDIRSRISEKSEVNFDPVSLNGLHLIGGVDISFVKDDSERACATLVVLSFPSLQVEFEITRPVSMTLPYMPGYLAFRECPHLASLLEELSRLRPDLYPQVVIVDGNGILHPRGCGLASHLGVVSGVATVGVAKKIMLVDGLTKASVAQAVSSSMEDRVDLVDDSGRVWGAALRGRKSTNPVYVSVGHRMSLDAAVLLVSRCCLDTRVPEPVRQADLRSREWLEPLGRQLRPAQATDGNQKAGKCEGL